MAQFTTHDRRGGNARSQNAHGLDQEMAALRRAGMTLPRHPSRAAETLTATNATIKERNLSALVNSYSNKIGMSEGEAAIASEMAKSRSMRRTASDMTFALPKRREPLYSFEDKGIPFRTDDEEERKKLRAWCRAFYATDSLVPLCIDIFCRFPIQGIELQCKDPELKRFYEQLFLEELEYEEFFTDLGREFWTVGEVNALANFNETLGVWDAEEILNPDDIEAQFSPFERDFKIKIAIPEYITTIINEQEPKWEYRLLIENYPEIIDAARTDERLQVSNVLLNRTINKITPWDAYGTPHMLRCFRQLIMQESLNAAQDAIADRLYAPFLLANLGIQDLGDGQPWIPDQGQLDNVRDDINMALAADFRLMVHHFGLDIKSVFGREQMPRLDNDYDRIEAKILQVWGIGQALISGSTQNSGAPYASSALNRELVTQLMTTYQRYLKKHYRKRAEIVAEAQEHFDYESSGGVRVPIYEEIVEVDPESGEEYVRKRPKLLIPEMHFATMNLRDESQERAFLEQLKGMGVPVSDETLLVNIPYEFNEELERIQREKVQKIIAEQQTNMKAIDALLAQGLPLPDDLQAIKDKADSLAMGPQAMGPSMVADPNQQQPQPGQQPKSDKPGDATKDVTAPASTPNVAPQMNGGAPAGAPPAKSAPPSKVQKLPRNQIKQRPEVSDEMRGNAPRAARMQTGPSVVGMRNKLGSDAVEDAIAKRQWTQSIRPAPPKKVIKQRDQRRQREVDRQD